MLFMLAQPAWQTAHLHCHMEQDLLFCLLKTYNSTIAGMLGKHNHWNSAQGQEPVQRVTMCCASCQSACPHNLQTAYQRLPHEGRYMRPTGAASGADDSRVIGPALGWRPLCLHPKPDQTFDINHKHVILEPAGIIHPSKDEQAAFRQHSAAVASACWQWFACLPCMAPHDISALAFIDSKDDDLCSPAVRYVLL